MPKQIKSSTISKISPKRESSSHKGENGRVLIVGGSVEYYGPPILAGLGALRSGADLVYLYVPECNYEVTRNASPNFIVRKFTGNFLSEQNVGLIVEFGKRCDSVVIGPGLNDRKETVKAAMGIVKDLNVPTVLDADAIAVLKKIKKFPLEQPLVITPHSKEFENLVDKDMVVAADDPKSMVYLRSLCMDLHINVLLKGATDFVCSDEGVVETNVTGNAGMTVGGTGDVLAGLVGGFLAQGMEGFDAARAGAYFSGKAGDYLKKKRGFGYTASEVADALPFVMN